MGTLRFLILIAIISLIAGRNNATSQFNFVYNDSIVVIKNTDTIPLAWAGGMSHPQFSTIDLDLDGIEELVAFEPESNIVNTYKRKLQDDKVIYTYWHAGSQYFPEDIRYKMKLVDFDN